MGADILQVGGGQICQTHSARFRHAHRLPYQMVGFPKRYSPMDEVISQLGRQ